MMYECPLVSAQIAEDYPIHTEWLEQNSMRQETMTKKMNKSELFEKNK